MERTSASLRTQEISVNGANEAESIVLTDAVTEAPVKTLSLHQQEFEGRALASLEQQVEELRSDLAPLRDRVDAARSEFDTARQNPGTGNTEHSTPPAGPPSPADYHMAKDAYSRKKDLLEQAETTVAQTRWQIAQRGPPVLVLDHAKSKARRRSEAGGLPILSIPRRTRGFAAFLWRIRVACDVPVCLPSAQGQRGAGGGATPSAELVLMRVGGTVRPGPNG
jgi:hypothetical protein